MNAVELPQRRNNRLTLLALIAIFALPPLLGWIFVLNPQWLPSESINKGTLIHPPRPMTQLALESTQGKRFDWSQVKDKWVFTVVNQGDCGETCIERLIHIRQIRRALAAESRRVARLLILLPDTSGSIPGPPPESGIEGTLILQVKDRQAADRIIETFQLGQIDGEQQMFVIDPHGDLMMRHDLSELKPKEILKDLELLLKASANWVTGEK